ncbi:hypothetical protein C6502_17215 [Candidatus Poribacteria bacterium]|nr:MAG: hypothetical protein C6502_17215 [Candidatus Poribacteria bacterium]
MHIGTITRLLLVLVMVAGLSACDQLQQLLLSEAPETETPTPTEERDHVWVVNQNGVEVPIPGTWVLVEHTNPNSTYVIGESFTLPPETPHQILLSEGTYVDGEGILWTRVNITVDDGTQFLLLERVDTSVTPNQLHLVVRTDESGLALLEYGEYPFDLPWHDVQVWELQ